MIKNLNYVDLAPGAWLWDYSEVYVATNQIIFLYTKHFILLSLTLSLYIFIYLLMYLFIFVSVFHNPLLRKRFNYQGP